MALAWTATLATGVQSIDEQHKEIFRRVNRLLEASARGQAQGEIDATIQFLGSYVLQHFAAEEGVMARAAYPRLAEHRRLHTAFVADFTALRQEYQRTGTSARFVIELQKRVVNWLLHHIGQEDRAIGEHLRARAAAMVAS